MNAEKLGRGIEVMKCKEVVNIYIHAGEIQFDSYVFDIDDNVFFLKRFVSLKSSPHVYVAANLECQLV